MTGVKPLNNNVYKTLKSGLIYSLQKSVVIDRKLQYKLPLSLKIGVRGVNKFIRR